MLLHGERHLGLILRPVRFVDRGHFDLGARGDASLLSLAQGLIGRLSRTPSWIPPGTFANDGVHIAISVEYP